MFLKGKSFSVKNFLVPTILVCAFFAIVSRASHSEIAQLAPNASAKIFSKEKLNSPAAGNFQISSDGEIVGGPIRAVGEPVDYSELLTPTALEDVFYNSYTNCYSSIRFCDARKFRFRPANLTFSGRVEKGFMQAKDFEDLNHVLMNVYGALGISVSTASDFNDANISIVAGSTRYLYTVSQQIGTIFAEIYFANLLDIDGGSGDKFLDWLVGTKTRGKSCFISTRDRAEKDRVILFFNPSEMKDCLPQLLFVGLGLNETVGFFPSVTGDDSNFNSTTLSDKIFFEALYDDAFPSSGSEEEIRSFFRSFLANNYEELLRSTDRI